ncbi:MAG: hypothetical protein KAJ10_14260, partial [Thermodesulfovibrionia bacterium]|nr:hypothetical protein [Thermodesulfovibrionia bacterium]
AMGGGGLTFDQGNQGAGYIIPPAMAVTSNGTYLLGAGAQTITITGSPIAPLNYLWNVVTTVTSDSIQTVVSIP